MHVTMSFHISGLGILHVTLWMLWRLVTVTGHVFCTGADGHSVSSGFIGSVGVVAADFTVTDGSSGTEV